MRGDFTGLKGVHLLHGIVYIIFVDVGIRELRNNLSDYLTRVRDGQEVVITDHGKAVARLTPIRGRKIDQLIARGVITRAKTATRYIPEEFVGIDGSLSDIVIEQRQ